MENNSIISYKSIIILLFIFTIITLKLVPASSPIEDTQAFWQINHITIYNSDKLIQQELKELILHEMLHQICWEKFGIYPKHILDHDSRCFTNKGRLLIS